LLKPEKNDYICKLKYSLWEMMNNDIDSKPAVSDVDLIKKVRVLEMRIETLIKLYNDQQEEIERLKRIIKTQKNND